MNYGIVQIDEGNNKLKINGEENKSPVYWDSLNNKWSSALLPKVRRRGRCSFVPLLSQTLKITYYSGRKTIVTVGTLPYGIAFDGTHVWVTNWTSGNVSRIVV